MRLIDATKVERKVEQFLQYRYEDYGTMFGPGLEILNIIRNAPTIAPPPNAPLTMDDLRKMDGEPVWVSWAGHSSEGWALVRVWSKVNSTIYMTYHNGATDLLGYILNNGAKIYRRRPKEEAK